MSGFGRRGMSGAAAVTAGEAMARRVGYTVPAPVSEPAASSELAAFLAAERQRNPPASDPGLTDVAIATPRARQSTADGGEKSMLLAYVLWWFACAIAAHRFYLGAIPSAVTMIGLFVSSFIVIMILPPVGLIMLVVWLLWVICDAFLIPGMVRATREPDIAAVFA